MDAAANAQSRLLRPTVLREFNIGERRATWLELFFDLCFVVAVAALARNLHDDPTLGGALAFSGLFVPIWWAWMGFTWYATAFDNDDLVYRGTILLAMLGIIAVAANVVGVPEGESTGFVLAYAALRALLVGLFIRARRHATTVRVFCTRYALGNSLGVLVWLLSLLVPEPARYGIWALGLFIEIATPIFAYQSVDVDSFDAGHITERYGLFTLIVLGESIVAVAAGVADVGWRLESTLTAVAGFTIAACIWWTYFDYVEARALRVGKRDSFLWGYGHLFIYAAIATVGVGTQLAIEGGVEAAVASVAPISAAPSGFGDGARGILCGGVAIYLLAISAIHSVNRHTFRDGTLAVRLVAATGVILIGVMGDGLGPLAVTALLALALGCVTAFEISRSDPSPELPAT